MLKLMRLEAQRINLRVYFLTALILGGILLLFAYFTANGGTLGPAKAANAGGVAVSALEMSQNSMRYNWTSEEVDEKLHNIMKSIFNNSVAAAEKYGLGFDLIKGANIAGFEKVVEAMISQGIY